MREWNVQAHAARAARPDFDISTDVEIHQRPMQNLNMANKLGNIKAREQSLDKLDGLPLLFKEGVGGG